MPEKSTYSVSKINREKRHAKKKGIRTSRIKGPDADEMEKEEPEAYPKRTQGAYRTRECDLKRVLRKLEDLLHLVLPPVDGAHNARISAFSFLALAAPERASPPREAAVPMSLAAFISCRGRISFVTNRHSS